MPQNLTRRTFLKNTALATTAGAVLPGLLNPARADAVLGELRLFKHNAATDALNNEDYWRTLRLAYSVSPGVINLNNGGVSPAPIIVQDMLDKYNRLLCELPGYYMNQVLNLGKEPLRENLAALAGVSAEEVAINRNATEALETIIFGLELQPGDEVIVCKQDYGSMLNAWTTRALRHGIKLVWLDLELPNDQDDYFVDIYANAVTDKTKVVYLTHVINLCGQILPVKKIAQAIRKKNPEIELVCDSAHGFCQLDFNIPDLDVDYWATSLHKWLCAPIGSGMLWVKKSKISKLWPLFAVDKPASDDIRKFEALGTRSYPIEQAIGYAIAFHNAIGTKNKAARLRYLKNYWSEQVKDIPRVKLFTSLKPSHSCAIGTFYIEGMPLKDIEERLFNKYQIYSVAIVAGNNHYIRITPNIYTQLYELDKLVRAIKDMASA